MIDDNDVNISQLLTSDFHFDQGIPCMRLDLNRDIGGKLKRSDLLLL